MIRGIMAHTISYNPEARIIEAKVQGELTLKGVISLLREIIILSKEKECHHLLNDSREATLKLTTMELYKLPQLIQEEFKKSELKPGKLKRALLVARDFTDFKFFETVTLNNGQNVKTFHDYNEAYNWLKEI